MKKYYGIDSIGSMKLQEVATRPAWAASDERRVIYVKDEGVFYVGNDTGWSPLAFNRTVVKRVSQASHGFAVGNAIRFNGTDYVKAIGTSMATAAVVGFVSDVHSVNIFSYVTAGYMAGFSGLTAGARYFLSAATAGAITTVEPVTFGQISKPVLVAISATEAIINLERANVVGDRIPVGATFFLLADDLWDGYLALEGAWIAKATYADLYAHYRGGGGSCIHGDSGDNFRLPDMRGRVPRGLDTSGTLDPDVASRAARGDGTSGAAVGTVQGDAYTSHNHNIKSLNGADGIAVTNAGTGANATGNMTNWGSADTRARVETTLSGASTETRMKNMAGIWVVKY